MVQQIDVAIAGGGPAGLAIAAALRKVLPDLQVKVFEGQQTFREQGAGVTLGPHGLGAIESISPELYSRFEETGFPLAQFSTYDEDGKLLTASNGRAAEIKQQFGKAMLMYGWSDIRDLLHSELPPGTVEFSSRVTGYTEVDGGVRLAFAEEHEPTEAKLLVGADGFRSCIRAQALGDGLPDFTGRVAWRARLPWREGLPRTGGWGKQWSAHQDGAHILQRRIVVLYPITNDRVVWTVSAAMKQLEAAGVTYDPTSPPGGRVSLQADSGSGSANYLERCLAVMEGFPADIMDVLRQTDPATVTEHGLFMRDPDTIPEQWGRGPVTLAGDAAHLAPPTGQGVNLALEDAVFLALNLQQEGITPQALRSYEKERTPRVKDVLLNHSDRAGFSDPNNRRIMQFKIPPLRRRAATTAAQCRHRQAGMSNSCSASFGVFRA